MVQRRYPILWGRLQNQYVTQEMEENTYRPDQHVTLMNPDKDLDDGQEIEVTRVDPGTPNSTTYRLNVWRERFDDFDPTSPWSYLYVPDTEH